MEIYQDIWVNGVVRTKGVRDCEGRYKPIAAHCRQYTRPITVLDIGANLGYYSFRLSSEFNCISVMIEGSTGYQKALLNLIKEQRCRDKLILLGTQVDLETLRELSKCEHFDVVLALRVVHHFKEPFSDVIDAIASLGDFTFFELPTAGEDKVRAKARVQNELADHSKVLASYNYEKVGEFTIHVGSTMSPLYMVENTDKTITRPFYGSPREIQHSVESTFTTKRLLKEDTLKRGDLVNEWVPGINIFTYLTLYGLFPHRKKVAQQIRNYRLPTGSPLQDIRPWNFILSGDRVALIDHTSELSSLGTPFRDNPENCLRNTALYVCAGIRPFRKMPYNKRPIVTKFRLLRYSLYELLSIIKDSLKRCIAVMHRLIDVLAS